MKKITLVSAIIVSAVVLSSCSLLKGNERDDAIKLEGMMPKEDNKTIDAMMKKVEENQDAMDKEEAKEDAMMKKDENMMEVQGYTAYNTEAVSAALAAKKNVVLFFHAGWCPTCKAADGNFQKETLPANTVVFKTDYDSNTDLRKKYGVTSQHTFVSLNADGSLKKKSSGALHFSDLVSLN